MRYRLPFAIGPVNWSQLPAARQITLVPKRPHLARFVGAWASTGRPVRSHFKDTNYQSRLLDESNSCARVRRNSRLTSCLASPRTLILRRPSVTPKIFFARSTRRRKFTLKMRSKISRSAWAKNYAPHIGDSSLYSGKPKCALLRVLRDSEQCKWDALPTTTRPRVIFCLSQSGRGLCSRCSTSHGNSGFLRG
jgi:hypothetical protein